MTVSSPEPVIGVITFPGVNCDRDCLYVIEKVAGLRAVPVWHEEEDLDSIDAVVLPGGFSYGDYLRAGAIAARSPVMRAVAQRAAEGMPVVGICNGFQTLLEAGLLPGAMRKNDTLRFICRPVQVRVDSARTPFTLLFEEGEVLTIPIAHYEGNYFAWPEELAAMEAAGQVVFRYCGPNGEDAVRHPEFNPNGSAGAVAGIVNAAGNVLGLMPHPERASEEALGSRDGLRVWLSLAQWLRERRRRPGGGGPPGAAGQREAARVPVSAVADPLGNSTAVPGVADWPGDPAAGAIAAGALWRELGLNDEEFRLIREGLGRLPSWTELGMFSVAWSEHCAYKHSKEALKRLPAAGERLLMGPGESAGVLDIGGGWALSVRLESHNHPSYVEPYQGAATGVGGIVRDILASGARPVALLNSLRFGRPEGPARNRYLFREVVAGIAGYGNAIGVPTVGGEVAFDPCYDTNPLVNVMCVGLLRADRVAKARADGPGNPVYLVGSRTGRDGIHGAGLLASRTFEDDESGSGQRPRVQVGDPFSEKLLIESCLEALSTGAVVGIQDLGAAGITSASSELAARAGTGIDLDLDRVPRREGGLTPFEVMLSESQERMMLVVERGREAEIEGAFARYGLPCARIGTVTNTGRLRVTAEGRLVADLPARLLADGAPRYPVPEGRRPAGGGGLISRGDEDGPGSGGLGRASDAGRGLRAEGDAGQFGPDRVAGRLRALLGSPDGASRAWIYTQFDHMVGVRTVLPPGHDAAVLRVLPDFSAPVSGPSSSPSSSPTPGLSPSAEPGLIALSLDAAERLAAHSAYAAACEAVLEGARNVASVGARPIGITNGLNLGNPERPEVMQSLADAVAGMADACRALGIPVTGGNVSLYNETGRRSIWPTVMVGMVGLLEAGQAPVPMGFQHGGDIVVLIGEPPLYLVPEQWSVDFGFEKAAVAFVAEAGRRGLLRSCHDVGSAGIAAALCEVAFGGRPGADGFSVELPVLPAAVVAGERAKDASGSGPKDAAGDLEALLFGAGGPCWVASVARERLQELKTLGGEAGVPVRAVGTVVPGRLRLAAINWGLCLDEPVGPLRRLWEQGLERAAGMAAGERGAEAGGAEVPEGKARGAAGVGVGA